MQPRGSDVIGAVAKVVGESTLLLLCCAEDTEVDLVHVIDALHREGMAPEVLAGVDSDVALLSNAVDNAVGPALFVLCQSPELDRGCVRKLAGLLSARAGPDHHVVTVIVRPQRPQTMLVPIRMAMRNLVASAQLSVESESVESESVESESVEPGDEPGPSHLSAASSTAPSEERVAMELMAELSKAEAAIERSDAVPGTPRRNERAAGRQPWRSGTRSSAPGASASSIGARRREPRGVIERRRPSHSAPAIDARREPESPSSEFRAAEAATFAKTDALSSDEMAGHPPRASGTPHRLLAVLGLCGMVCLLVMAGAHVMGDLPLSVYRQVDPSARMGSPALREGRPPAVQEKAVVLVKPVVDVKPMATTPPGPQAGSNDQIAVRRRPPVAPSPSPPVHDPKPRSPVPTEAKRSNDRRWGILPPPKETMTWDGAHAYCEEQPIDGGGRWRLAKRTEIRKLRRARMLPATGTFWSADKADADDEAYAFDASTGRSDVYLTIEPVGRPACVRRR